MSDVIPMTRTGYNKIKAEVNRLKNEEMPKIAEKIAEARAEGDLKENAEYHAARENQGMMQAKIYQLADKLARSSIVDFSKLPKDCVVFGVTVIVKDLSDDEEEEFTLVGGGEEDYDTGKILVTSPLAQGLMEKKIGDKVEIDVPAGKLKFEIIDIKFPEEE